ncbi:MAG: RICIN domain-containing protein [Janthinobacterium lividum]
MQLLSYCLCVLLGFSMWPATAQVLQGTFAIRNVKTGLLLRIQDARPADGTPLVAYTPTNWKCMTWNFEHVEGNVYRLQNLFTHKTFQPDATPAAGAALRQRPLAANQVGQQWEFELGTAQTYRIRLRGTALYVAPANATGAANTPIVLAEKADTPLQFWTLYIQHPTM